MNSFLHVEEGVDWDNGLPADVLALVARAGGMEAMKHMRGVSRQWQEGFELGVKGIKVSPFGPPLPWEGEVASLVRFPAVNIVDLGISPADGACLKCIRAFPTLKSLVLGADWDLACTSIVEKCLASQLADSELQHLQGIPLTSLDLSFCVALTGEGLKHLQGMPLKHLSLCNCEKIVFGGQLKHLCGLPLTSLSLEGCYDRCSDERRLELSQELRVLRGMPLTDLSFRWGGWLTNAGLDHLRGLPLTSLDLTSTDVFEGDNAQNVIDGMHILQRLPLLQLSLSSCGLKGVVGLEMLRGLKLVSLDLSYSHSLSDEGLSNLRCLPLTSLDLSHNSKLSDAGLKCLWGIPIAHLSLSNCVGFSSAGMEFLRDLPLKSLDLSSTKISDEGLGLAAGSAIDCFKFGILSGIWRSWFRVSRGFAVDGPESRQLFSDFELHLEGPGKDANCQAKLATLA